MKKKFSKILGVGLTVALVASLLVIAAPVSADVNEIEVPTDLWVEGGGFAAWVETPVHSEDVVIMGDYATQLSILGATPADAGAVAFMLYPIGFNLDDITVLDFYEYVVSGYTEGYPATLSLYLDANDNGVWDGWDTAGTAGGDDVLYLEDPTGAFTDDIWENLDVLTNFKGTPASGNGTGPGPYYNTIAYWQQAANYVNYDKEVLGIDLAIGWNAASYDDVTMYVDDITIGNTIYTFDLEPTDYELRPPIAKNVKTSEETFTVWDIIYDGEVAGDLVSNWLVTKGEGDGDVTVVAGGQDGDNFITVRMVTTGDCIITCDVAGLVRPVNAEKKWGEIAWTELTAWSDDPCVQRPTGVGDTEITRAGIEVGEEVLVQELVIAEFLPGLVPAPAGGAKITWWLLTNDEWDEAQLRLEELLERFDSYTYESGDLGWGHGCGQYAEWAGDPTFIPEDILNSIYALYEADYTEFIEEECLDTPDTTKTVTFTDHIWEPLGEGYTNTTVKFSEVGTTGVAEPVIVVLLADYPLDKNGQNNVCVEYFKFTPKIPVPPAQVKTTQVRWAGEKIVLEKYWGEEYTGKLVMFALEEGSIGDLIPLDPEDWESSDSRTVFTFVDCDGVARVMFKTEQQGQVDVECVLYDCCEGTCPGFDEQFIPGEECDVIANTGFVIYYLFLEEVTPWELEPEPVDPEEDAVFAVDVKGCFWNTSLPGTTRPERIVTFEVDGGGTVEYLLPAGRYVLPDDWPLMAGPNWRMLRPWMDLMAEPGGWVWSDYMLGPFAVVNSPSGVAALPCIGPFSSLQLWSIFDMWITDALVPADGAVDMDPFTGANESWDLRNTVIPDDWLSPFDCPMPPAEIHFVITDYILPPLTPGPYLFDAFKNTGPTYDWPFYASEIPANRLIPPMLCQVEGYWWDSWEFNTYAPDDAYEREGPYWFYWDLEQTDLDDTILEAYSDNLGACAVYIDALGGPGWVTIKAYADYPYLPAKFPGIESDEVTQLWGAVELNPFFLADETIVEVDEVVTFSNETTFGTLPYVAADWDWGDGTTHGTTAVNNGDTITHAYATPGVYSVILTMTDSTPTTRWEERPDYITVWGEAPGRKGDFNHDGNIDFDDFVLFVPCYLCVDPEPCYNVIGDFNNDGVIDFDDFMAFAAVYGT